MVKTCETVLHMGIRLHMQSPKHQPDIHASFFSITLSTPDMLIKPLHLHQKHIECPLCAVPETSDMLPACLFR